MYHLVICYLDIWHRHLSSDRPSSVIWLFVICHFLICHLVVGHLSSGNLSFVKWSIVIFSSVISHLSSGHLLPVICPLFVYHLVVCRLQIFAQKHSPTFNVADDECVQFRWFTRWSAASVVPLFVLGSAEQHLADESPEPRSSRCKQEKVARVMRQTDFIDYPFERNIIKMASPHRIVGNLFVRGQSRPRGKGDVQNIDDGCWEGREYDVEGDEQQHGVRGCNAGR